ncbi:flagellin [Aminobacter sp. AP02]|uniref:flagellin N-terminal helical domain-containing protein n=1 Tax=Aminobacter sp. AP02 TaxID=2135737 RepID=UPI000D6B3977|nr:flagellin [Aminobacter sp. AP02]PWK71647.1 flagellin [Aminobacter sp. AP02]
MSSINTNASAMTALQTLAATNKNLSTTQGRIATGMRVAEASDNAAYWSIATTMRSDNKANSVVQDALGLGAAKVDTAYAGMKSAIEVVDKIKEKVLLAKATDSATERAKIQSEITTYQAQLKDNIAGASYAGSNLLKTGAAAADPTKLSVITSYNRGTGNAVTTGTIDIAFANTRLIDPAATGTPVVGAGILDKAGSRSDVSILNINITGTNLSSIAPKDAGGTAIATPTEADKFDALLTDIESALSSMATGAAELGAAKARIDLQKDFVSKLSDSIDRGVGQLVDADMNKESTRLQALQVQQQLGIQALSIANSNTQSIMSLFRG